MDVKLIVVAGKASKDAIPLKLPTVVGRSREADLTVSHPMVSRRHCEIFDDEGVLNVRDLGSLNGTIVGGDRIDQAVLHPNDEFTIGPLTFRAEYRCDDSSNGSIDEIPKCRPPSPRSPVREESPPKKEAPWSSGEKSPEAANPDPEAARSDTDLPDDVPDDDLDAFLQGLQED